MLRDRGHGSVAIPAGDPVEAILHCRPVVVSESARVYVYGESDRVSVKFTRPILAEEAAGSAVIIVSVDGPTPFARKECGDAVQFMAARALCVNVTRHGLVPAHTPVPAEEQDEDLLSKLPTIFETDPVVQYYAWPRGIVVRIERRFGARADPLPARRQTRERVLIFSPSPFPLPISPPHPHPTPSLFPPSLNTWKLRARPISECYPKVDEIFIGLHF